MPVTIIQAAVETFAYQKQLADRAIAQVTDENLKIALDPNTNAIAVIMKHMAGNMLSRWTDFLHSDGEKNWRNRDDEFVDSFTTRQQILDHWEAGWQCVFDALDGLKDDDLGRTIHIRGQAHTVIRAIFRQIDHYGYHVGQIVQIARVHAGDHWQTLTIARGQSQQYTQQLKSLNEQ